MSLVLNTNIDSLIAQNSLTTSGNQLTTALQQLSSGLRINTAADDAAGFAIAIGMTSQVNGLNQAISNANDGVSLAQTASGAMTEITNDLQSMRDLAVESLNATNSSTDRKDLNAQFQQLMQDINSVSTQTQFNGVNLLDGTFQGATFQVGANAGQSITVGAISSAQSNAIGNYYVGTSSGTAGAYSSASLAASGGLGTTSMSTIDGTSVTLNVDVTTSNGNKSSYTTNSISLSGTNSTDLKSIAAAVNQSVSSVGGMVATVTGDSGTGGEIQMSGTSNATVKFSVANVYNSSGTTMASGASALQDLGLDKTDTISTTSTAKYVSNLDVSSVDDSNLALISIDQALQQLATSSADLGAYQNRFQAAVTGLQTNSTNLSSAKSTIEDADYASATTELSKAQILQQASTAMVAQANTIPQNILSLLQKLP